MHQLEPTSLIVSLCSGLSLPFTIHHLYASACGKMGVQLSCLDVWVSLSFLAASYVYMASVLYTCISLYMCICVYTYVIILVGIDLLDTNTLTLYPQSVYSLKVGAHIHVYMHVCVCVNVWGGRGTTSQRHIKRPCTQATNRKIPSPFHR